MADTVRFDEQQARWPGWPGVGALVLACGMVVLEIVAIVLGSSRQWQVATLLGQVVIVLTIVAFLLGLVAVVLGRGRRLGVIAMVVAVLANPLVQLWLLGLAGTS